MKFTRIITVCFCFIMLLMNTQCEDDDFVEAPCGQTVIIDGGFYDSAESNFYNLISAEIEGNCLNIDISASGCDGNSWSMVLVDSGDITESFSEDLPSERFLKFVFSNEEVCLAVFSQSRSFDLTSIQIDDANEIILNIEDFPEPLNYAY